MHALRHRRDTEAARVARRAPMPPGGFAWLTSRGATRAAAERAAAGRMREHPTMAHRVPHGAKRSRLYRSLQTAVLHLEPPAAALRALRQREVSERLFAFSQFWASRQLLLELLAQLFGQPSGGREYSCTS
jgi:hypothetical protein